MPAAHETLHDVLNEMDVPRSQKPLLQSKACPRGEFQQHVPKLSPYLHI